MKQVRQKRGSAFFQIVLGFLLVGMLLSACSSPTNPGSGKSSSQQGVSPLPDLQHLLASVPPAAKAVTNGVPLPANLVKTLTFNLVYNDDAMEQAVEQIYTPGSSTYQQYLTPDQIVQRYAVSDAQLNTVKSWLTQHGYTDLVVDPLRASISAQATVASIEQSLQIQMQSYDLQGHKFFMQVGNPTLSGQVAGLVSSIVGLDNFALPLVKPPFSTLQEAANGKGNCKYYGAKMTLTSTRLASVYQDSTLYKEGLRGQGMTIGVAEFDEPYDPKDVANYTECAVGSAPHIQNIQVDGPTPRGSGEGEATLDLEMIAGLAPQAQILDYQAGTNNDDIPFAKALLDLFSRVAKDHRVQVLSVSYGTGEDSFSQSEENAVNRSLRTLAAEGISVFISSGDCGAFSDRLPDIAVVSFPASAPYAIAVGGTYLQVNTKNARASEQVWGDNDGAVYCQNEWGSGGGVSENTDFKRPRWQTGSGTTSRYDGTSTSVVDSNFDPVKAPDGLRQVPDIAAAAYPNIDVYYQGTWYLFGGTSAAAPIWAAGALLIDQGLKAHRKPFLGGVPTFYQMANHPGKWHPYTDITRGNNLFYPATRGWDYSTGWGSPDLNDILQLKLHS
jgi:kumamolisin